MSLIQYLTRTHFAEHVLQDALGTELARLNAQRPLILIDDEGRVNGGLAALDDALPCNLAAVWGPRLNRAAADQAASADDLAALQDTECDAVLAFGGATALRTGRALAKGSAKVLPLIVVPTTTADMGLSQDQAPVGAETTRPAVPDVILCDPTLTYRLGPEPTAAHGFDGLARCIEAFLAPGFNPPADGIALDGIYRIARNLEAALEDGTRPAARREVMAGALNGALAGRKGTGGIDALTCALEAEIAPPLPHGRLSASILRHVLDFNRPAIGARLERIATALGAPREEDTIIALAEFGTRIGLPNRLGHLGLGPAALQRAAAAAASHPATQTNPRHITKEDYFALLGAAI